MASRSAMSAASTSVLIRSAMEGRGLKSSIRTGSPLGRDLCHLGAERLDGDHDQTVHVVLGQLAQRSVPADPLHLRAERAHDCGQRLSFLFGEVDHGQSFSGFAGEGRLAAHGAEPAAGAGRARPVGVEPAETAGAGCADGAEQRARMPEPITARSIRSRCRGDGICATWCILSGRAARMRVKRLRASPHHTCLSLAGRSLAPRSA